MVFNAWACLDLHLERNVIECRVKVVIIALYYMHVKLDLMSLNQK